MSPKLGLLVAIPVAVGLLAASPAEAYWRRGGYYHGGGFGVGPAIAGAVVGLGIGAALTGGYGYGRPYYAPPPVYYAPPPVVYAPPPAYYGYPGYYR
jgi:hypothetical protein